MASPAQTLANCQNAQQSTGPRTAAGKAASAANATKHGLSSAFTVLPNEDLDEYDEVLNGFMEEFEPCGYHETFLVHEMIQARWRIIRIHRLETSYLSQTQLDDPSADPDQAILANMAAKGTDILNALARYAAAAQRTYYKAHKELRESRRSAVQQKTADHRRSLADVERALSNYINAPMPRLMPHPAKSPETHEESEFESLYETNPISPVPLGSLDNLGRRQYADQSPRPAAD